MITAIIPKVDTTEITNNVIKPDGKIVLQSAEAWRQYEWNTFRAFCHVKARYGIHTLEQNKFLNDIINGRHAIEIGAGSGDIGHHLPIHMTDSKLQDNPIIKASYAMSMQPTIEYPKDVEKIEALEAVKKHQPKVVVASWITTYAPHEMPYGSNPFGIKEPEILDLIDTFILIGNIDIHGDKPILHRKHDEYYYDWIVSRGKNQGNNRIWVWGK